MRRSARFVLALTLLALAACTSLPKPRQQIGYAFPKDAYLEPPRRAYEALGVVRSKVDFVSLDPGHDEAALCRNYFNKAVADLVKYAKEKGGDAVIDVKSVVFLEVGRMETYKTPECSDDGEEGQALAQGIAVKWKTSAPSPGSMSPLVIPESSMPKPRVQDRIKPSPSRTPQPTRPVSPAEPLPPR